MMAEEIEAIVGGYHGDAFRILGPHAVHKKGQSDRWEIRAFLPQAEAAEVVCGAQRVPMAKRHQTGFFVGCLDGTVCRYQLALRLWDGREVQIEDPYRFGPLISDTDLYLHTEGTLYEAYRTFGAHVTCGRSAGRPFRGVGSQRAECHGDRRVQRLGHPPPSDAPAERRRLGDFPARPE